MDKLKMMLIKTNECCFISDCYAKSGYDYEYHNTKLYDLFFDGENPRETNDSRWLMINKYPELITKKKTKRVNERYELKDIEMESKALPLILIEEEINDDICSLYSFEYDIKEKFEDVELEIETVLEIEDFSFAPVINFEGFHKTMSFGDEIYKITNADVKHQMLDKIILPKVLLHNYPCSISSKKLYDIVRNYIKNNIDHKIAMITSDYDFCFTVEKRLSLYDEIGNKVKEQTYEVYEMTHANKKYDNYTVIEPIHTNNEKELEEEINSFLEKLITEINEPLELCPKCEGMGHINVDKINTNLN